MCECVFFYFFCLVLVTLFCVRFFYSSKVPFLFLFPMFSVVFRETLLIFCFIKFRFFLFVFPSQAHTRCVPRAFKSQIAAKNLLFFLVGCVCLFVCMCVYAFFCCTQIWFRLFTFCFLLVICQICCIPSKLRRYKCCDYFSIFVVYFKLFHIIYEFCIIYFYVIFFVISICFLSFKIKTLFICFDY